MVIMRKAVYLTAIIVIVLIAQIVAVEANPYMFLQFTRIQINSPDSKVYVSPNVDISFDYYVDANSSQIDSFSYSIDSSPNFALESSKSSIPQIGFTKYSVLKTLENLPNDNHKLVVYAYFSNNTISIIMNRTVVVDTNYIQPTPVIISPQNQATYNSEQVAITYTINAKIISSSYSLDTSEFFAKWTDFTGNITLQNLSYGSHKLRLSLTIQPHSGVQYEHYYPIVDFNVGQVEEISTLTPTPYPTLTTSSTPLITLTPSGTMSSIIYSPTFSLFYLMPSIIVVAVIVAIIAVIIGTVAIYRTNRKETAIKK
jgi:hypothetical protein